MIHHMENLVMDMKKATRKNKRKSNSNKNRGRRSRGKDEPMKVVYISNPMKFEIKASEFRSLVQELTGQDAQFPPSLHHRHNHPDPPPPANSSLDSSSNCSSPTSTTTGTAASATVDSSSVGGEFHVAPSPEEEDLETPLPRALFEEVDEEVQEAILLEDDDRFDECDDGEFVPEMLENSAAFQYTWHLDLIWPN